MEKILLCLSVSLTGCAHQLTRDYDRLVSSKILKELPLEETHWRTEYTGGGVVRIPHNKSDQGILLAPARPEMASQTFSALVLSDEVRVGLQQDFIFEVEVINQQQLREFKPQPWEVFWFFFNYRKTDDGYKETNYFIPKFEKGLEVGTASREVDQKFLKTTERPSTELTQSETYTILKKGQELKIFKNRRLVLEFQGDREQPLYDHPGQFGLYSEDAIVKVIRAKFAPL